MRTLAIIFLLIAVPLAGGTFQPVRESDFWNNVSGIHEPSFIRRFISNEVCWRDIDHDLACRRGLKAVQSTLLKAGLSEAEVGPLMIPPIDPETGRSDYDLLLQSYARLKDRVPLAMVYGLMGTGVIGYFDAHARLVPSGLVEALFRQTSTDFRGSGIETEVTSHGVFIRRVLPASPAEKAGLQVHDQIIGVNGRAITGFGRRIYDTWQTFRGTNMDSVTYQIRRLPQPITLKFGMISSPVVESSVLRTSFGRMIQRRVGVLTIRNFNSGVCETAESQIQDLQRQGIDGLLLDLRSNLGGLIEEGVCVASLFIGAKQAVYRSGVPVLIPEDYKLHLKDIPSPASMTGKQRSVPAFPDLPLLVLQNSQSASASEITASALQDHERAWIVGETSHGKGSSQIIVPLAPGLRIAYTVAENFRASGESLQVMGVTPNFEVAFNREEKRSYLREIHLNPTAFRPRRLVQWQDPRAREKSKIENCMRPNMQNVGSMLARREIGYDDNQMATALAVFLCTHSPALKHKR